MGKVKKLLKGLKNVYFAPYVNGEYEAPVKIDFAKTIEGKLNYESEAEWADDMIVDQSSDYAGGEGNFKCLGLTPSEASLLFGNEEIGGGISVKTTDVAPVGAFLFERGKKSSDAKRLFVIYACQCSPTGFSGETIEEGKASASVEEIDFSIGQLDNGLVFYYIDTDSPNVVPEQINNWFTEVQMPQNKGLSVLKEKK